MTGIIGFIDFIIYSLLTLLVWAMIANAIVSWLVAFQVINLRNPFAYNVAHMLEAVTRPILRPFQRIIPPLGGVDITPILAILLIVGIRDYLWRGALLPLLAGALV